MDISPQRVRTAEFSTVKRGLDPEEVRAFLVEVAAELERAQNQSTAMEARARAAVARLQEISEATPNPDSMAVPVQNVAAERTAPTAAEPQQTTEVNATVDQAETISRTLLLAQRTADNAIAEAEAEAAKLRADAESEATRTIESTREMTERLIEEAREEARRTGQAERVQVESEVNSLLARRDFLESDVDHLQSFLVEERSRLRDAASSIMEMAERVPAGLGEVRRPLLSASDDEQSDDAAAGDAAAELEPTAEVGIGDAADDASGAPVAVEAEADVEADVDGDAEPTIPGSGPQDVSGGERRPSRLLDTDQLVIKTDIADDGPTGFSYDSSR